MSIFKTYKLSLCKYENISKNTTSIPSLKYKNTTNSCLNKTSPMFLEANVSLKFSGVHQEQLSAYILVNNAHVQ